jgi:hypothetical protein
MKMQAVTPRTSMLLRRTTTLNCDAFRAAGFTFHYDDQIDHTFSFRMPACLLSME